MKKLLIILIMGFVLCGAILLRRQPERESEEGILRDSQTSHTAGLTNETMNEDSGNKSDRNSEAWSTFTDRKTRYQLRFPRSWRLTDHSATNQMIRADIVKNKDFGFQIRAYFEVDDDLEAYAERYIAQFMSEMQQHWSGTITETNRTCQTALQHEQCTSSIDFARTDGQHWVFKEYLFRDRTRNTVVVLQSGYRFVDRELHGAELEAIADTFTFEP
ncbi:hypothetical protein JXQ70_08180 [bacterium]|nr:hypothetical protein [bacterium]